MATTSLTGSYGYRNYLNEIQRPYERDIALCYIKANGITTKVGKPHTEGAMLRRQKRVIDQLIQPTWVALSAANASPQTQPLEDYEEGVFFVRDPIQIDRAYMQDKNYVNGNPIQRQIQSYVMGRSFLFDNALINNFATQGPIQNPYGVTGLKYRLIYPDVTGSGCNSACQVQATADISFAGLSSVSGIKLAYDLSKLFSHMGNAKGTGIVLLMSPQAFWLFAAAIKNQGMAGGFTVDKDAFDRTVIKFMDAEISECGFLPPQNGGLQTAPIIDDAQDINGWSSGDAAYNSSVSATQPQGAVYTSIYAIQTSGPEAMELWQASAPWMVSERVPGQFYHVVLFEHSLGIWQPYTRSIGRLYGLKTNGPTQD